MVKDTTKSFWCSRVSGRHLLLALTFLAVFVVLNMFSTSSKLGMVVDVSMKVKTGMLDTLHEIIDFSTSQRINGTFSMKSFTTKQEIVADYRRWLQMVNKTANQTMNVSIVLPSNNTADRQLLTLQNIPVTVKARIVNIDGTAINETNGARKDVCQDCFKHDFKYVIDNPDICKLFSKDQVVKVVIMITTTHGNFQKRLAIRNTWLSPYRNNTGEVRYAFLLGETKIQDLRVSVQKESETFKDILKEDFVDAYSNLTFKTVMAFKWISTKCAHAQYVMKTDDDMYVNVKNLINATVKFSDAFKNGIGGACSQKAAPIRNKNSKWFASVKSYPNPHYPGFCSGTGYVTSSDVARKVYEVSPTVPFFHLEDVYVSLCINKLKFKLTRIPGFNMGAPAPIPCNYKNDVLITAHGVPPNRMERLWNSKCIKKKDP